MHVRVLWRSEDSFRWRSLIHPLLDTESLSLGSTLSRPHFKVVTSVCLVQRREAGERHPEAREAVPSSQWAGTRPAELHRGAPSASLGTWSCIFGKLVERASQDQASWS